MEEKFKNGIQIKIINLTIFQMSDIITEGGEKTHPSNF